MKERTGISDDICTRQMEKPNPQRMKEIIMHDIQLHKKSVLDFLFNKTSERSKILHRNYEKFQIIPTEFFF